jgi:hypothetical protein
MEILYLSEGPNRRQLQLKDVVRVELGETPNRRHSPRPDTGERLWTWSKWSHSRGFETRSTQPFCLWGTWNKGHPGLNLSKLMGCQGLSGEAEDEWVWGFCTSGFALLVPSPLITPLFLSCSFPDFIIKSYLIPQTRSQWLSHAVKFPCTTKCGVMTSVQWVMNVQRFQWTWTILVPCDLLFDLQWEICDSWEWLWYSDTCCISVCSRAHIGLTRTQHVIMAVNNSVRVWRFSAGDWTQGL